MAPSALSLSTTLPNGVTNVPYMQQIVTGGLPPYSINLSATQGAPSGVGVNINTGAFTFTAPTAGPYGFSVQVTDSSSQTAQGAFTVTVYDPLAITTSALSPGVSGVAYSHAVVATGGKAPLTYSLSGGSLPANLTLDPSSGLISGTPGAAATSNFVVKVTDGAGQVQTAAPADHRLPPLSASPPRHYRRADELSHITKP